MQLVLPWPPSVNHYWRHAVVGRGRGAHATVYIGDEGKEYRKTAMRIVQRLGITETLACRVAIRIVACPPDRRVRNLDNLLKATLDSLTHAGVWADDDLCDPITVARGDVAADGLGLLRIRIRPMPERQQSLKLPKPKRVIVDPLSSEALAC